jgi:type II secretory pathway predicted ATPase ExeA
MERPLAQMSFENLLNGDFNPSTDEDWEFLRAAAQHLFEPKTPIDDDKLFAGRLSQINDILDAVYEKGGHAVIFGERGVGKTSLARIVDKKIAPVLSNLDIVQVSCGSGDDFYTIWGNAFNNFSAGDRSPTDHFRESENPYEIYNALKDLDQSQYHLFIFDEFDRIADTKTLHLMGDLIKHFSNEPINITIIVVGVGETLMDLFAGHESISRCCSQIKMPRMSYDELSEILDDRIPSIGFSLADDVRNAIIRLSQGMPGYIHLLGQLALKSAISRKSKVVERVDFNSALDQALEKSDYQTKQEYYKAVSSANKDNKYKEVLLACALAKSNELGHFYAGDIREPYSVIRGKTMEIPNFAPNLSNLCSVGRGPALTKSGSKKRYQYRFANPLLQPLTVMIGVKDQMIDLDAIPDFGF